MRINAVTREFVTLIAEMTTKAGGAGGNMDPFTADLECVLYLGRATKQHLISAVAAVSRCGGTPVFPEWLVVWTQDSTFERFSNLADAMKEAGCLVARFTLGAIGGEISVEWEAKHPTLTITTPEQGLRGAEGGISAHSLRTFADCCKEVATSVDARRVYLGTEMIGPAQATMKFAEDHNLPGPEEAFSDMALKRLRDWYANEYGGRWTE